MRPGGDLAGYGSRVAATLLDALVIGTVAVLVAIVASSGGLDEDDTGTFVVVVALLSSLLYAPTLMCRKGEHNGQTLGKQALGIRVVKQDATPITAGPALLREFVGKGLLGLIPFFTIVDYLFPLGDARRQAIHDKLVSTFVVRADAVPDLGPGDPFGPTTAPEALGPAPESRGGWGPPVREPAHVDPPPPRAEPDAWAPPAPAPAPPPSPRRDDEDEIRGPFGPSSS